MEFLDFVLSRLEKGEIPYEEHYDPRGFKLYRLYCQKDFKPMLMYNSLNPYQVMISNTWEYTPSVMEIISSVERSRIKIQLFKLKLKLSLHHKLELLDNKIVFVIGFVLESDTFQNENLNILLRELQHSHTTIIKKTIEIIQKY